MSDIFKKLGLDKYNLSLTEYEMTLLVHSLEKAIEDRHIGKIHLEVAENLLQKLHERG